MAESRARLFCPLGACRGARFEITGEATIGRGEGHAVRLDQQAVSKDHARIFFDSDAGCFVLEDLGSTNGTALDGIPVVGRERLGHLHVITFAGLHEFVFQDLGRSVARHGEAPRPDPSAPASIEETRATSMPLAIPGILDRPGAMADADEPDAEPRERTEAVRIPPAIPGVLDLPAAAATVAGPGAELDAEPRERTITNTDGAGTILGEKTPYRLEVTLEDGKVRRFPLCSGDNLVGRGRGADVRLDSRHLSRRHAVLRILGSTITLRDEGSRNHTFLEGQRIGAAVPIEPGDRLRFGGIEARLIMGGTDRE